MNKIQGEKAQKFFAWLAVAKGFLPKSMTLEEASHLFLRRCDDEEKEAIKHGTQKH